MKLFRSFAVISSAASLAMGVEATKPVNYGVVLFPGFQALDVFGPLDALNLLSFTEKINLRIFALDMNPVSTAPRMALVGSNFSESVVPTDTFDCPPDDLDVLIVPGGIGTRAADIVTTVDFVKAAFPKVRHSFITVCTGAGIAARAGVLDGKNATTNKRAWAATTALGPNVNWKTHARWVQDGNIWTSSGVSAGIDVMLAFISSTYGEDVANNTANGMEYERHTDPSWDPFADLYGLPPN